MIALQPTNHYVNKTFASWYVTNHITSFKICDLSLYMHLLQSSHIDGKVCCLKLMNTCGILQKWIVECGNGLTKIKVQQINEKWQCWKWNQKAWKWSWRSSWLGNADTAAIQKAADMKLGDLSDCEYIEFIIFKLRMLSQNTIYWSLNRNLFLSVLGTESTTSRYQVTQLLVRITFLAHSWLTSHCILTWKSKTNLNFFKFSGVECNL